MADQIVNHSHAIKSFETSGGGRIFQIPIQEFPILWGYVYLVLIEEGDWGNQCVLIDTGSGFGDSNQHLEDGLRAILNSWGGQLGWRI